MSEHTSVVQSSPSPHWASPVQQPGTGAVTHWFRRHDTVSQICCWPHCAAVVQQPAIGVFTHSPWPVHASSVQTLPSSHVLGSSASHSPFSQICVATTSSMNTPVVSLRIPSTVSNWNTSEICWPAN